MPIFPTFHPNLTLSPYALPFMQGSADRTTSSPGDVAVVLRIVLLLVPAVLLRNRWPLPRLVRLFESAPRPGHDAARLARARQLTDGILHRLFGGAFCMKRALILYHFMTRSNVPGRIVFGVARDGSSLKGHAWLEVDGSPYHESDRVSDFKVIYAHPDDARDDAPDDARHDAPNDAPGAVPPGRAARAVDKFGP